MMEQVDAGTNLVKQLKLLGSSIPIYLLSSIGDNLDMTTDYSSLALAGILHKSIDDEQLLWLLETKPRS